MRAGERDRSKANQLCRATAQRPPPRRAPFHAAPPARGIPFRSGRRSSTIAARGKRITSLLLTSPRDIAEENKDINTNPDVRRHIMVYAGNRFGWFAAALRPTPTGRDRRTTPLNDDGRPARPSRTAATTPTTPHNSTRTFGGYRRDVEYYIFVLLCIFEYFTLHRTGICFHDIIILWCSLCVPT